MMERDKVTNAEFAPRDELADLPRIDLVKRWRSYNRVDPPKGITIKLLVRAVAYEMQVKRHGGLKPSTSRRLLKIAQGDAVGTEIRVKPSTGLKPGARLLREWNGVTHSVEVIKGGFIWNDEAYRSLSSVAHAITGARWSGPLFFGLRKPASKSRTAS